MSKLYFKYAPMEAGKSLDLLKTAHNFEKKGRKILLFKPSEDDRAGTKMIRSRIGSEREAFPLTRNFPNKIYEYAEAMRPDAILIDEAQFLSRETIEYAARVVDELEISVFCYGLKNDFKNELFEGSAALIVFADKLEEIRTICDKCDRKALMNLRLCNGVPVREGDQIQIGDEEYISVCRRCYKEAFDQ